MKNISMKSIQLIKDSYANYHHSVYLYLYYKIGHKEEAEDLAQDVYVRLMDYDRMLCAETIKYFIFTIARNLVTDYLRRYYKRQEVTSYLYEHAVTYTNETEARVVADDLEADKSISDISEELNLSHRTVENHLRIGRHEVREFIKQCI